MSVSPSVKQWHKNSFLTIIWKNLLVARVMAVILIQIGQAWLFSTPVRADTKSISKMVLTDTDVSIVIPADGKSRASIALLILDDKNQPQIGKMVEAIVAPSDKGKIMPLVSEQLTDSTGRVEFPLQAGLTVADNVPVTFKAGNSEMIVKVRLTGNNWSVDYQQIIAAVIGFILVMILFSLIAEKSTDFVKNIILILWQTPITVASMPGVSYGKLLADETGQQLNNVYVLMFGNLPPTPLAREQVFKQVIEQDKKNSLVVSRQTTVWRLIALVFGIIFAFFLHLDALRLLSPLISPEATKVIPSSILSFAGKLLIGFGASAGASYWSDFLDKLTAAKKTAENAAAAT